MKDAVLSVCFLFLLILIAAKLQGAGDPVSGPFRVVDGDTLAAGSLRLRLEGIDAPEIDQTCSREAQVWDCGLAARQALDGLVSGKAVTCHGTDEDRYGRLLATCSAEGQALNGAMVERGMALATGVITYRREQMRAQEAGRGIWAGEFDRPSSWRQARKREQEGGGPLRQVRDVMSLRWL